MTDLLYGNLPTFTQGQVLSASAHMNTLNRYIGSVRDDCFGASIPFIGRGLNMIRHHWDTLAWYIEAAEAGTLTYDGNVVASWAGAGTETGTADISALGLVVGAFYEVNVTGDGAKVYQIYETTTPSYPSLATFNDGTTPTAAEWQELSDYADELGDMLSHPYALSTRWRQRGAVTLAAGCLHRARYLYVESRITAPDLHNSEATLTVVYDPGGAGETVLGAWTTAGGLAIEEYLDLETLVPALAFGDIYNLELQYTDAGGVGPPDFVLYAVYETPCTASACDEAQATGYANPTAWAHGQYVYGSTSDPNVQQTVDNLEALDDVVQPVNWACPLRNEGEGASNAFLFGVRHRRWLHYMSNAYIDEDGETVIEDGVLAYNLRGTETTVNLPASPVSGDWLAADLDRVDGLWPGTPYHSGGVSYAIEDVRP